MYRISFTHNSPNLQSRVLLSFHYNYLLSQGFEKSFCKGTYGKHLGFSTIQSLSQLLTSAIVAEKQPFKIQKGMVPVSSNKSLLTKIGSEIDLVQLSHNLLTPVIKRSPCSQFLIII